MGLASRMDLKYKTGLSATFALIKIGQWLENENELKKSRSGFPHQKFSKQNLFEAA